MRVRSRPRSPKEPPSRHFGINDILAVQTQSQEAGAASASFLLVPSEGLTQMVGRQRTAVTVLDPIGQWRVLGQLLAGGQTGRGSLPFDLNLACAIDDVPNKQLCRGADCSDDVGSNRLRESMIDELHGVSESHGSPARSYAANVLFLQPDPAPSDVSVVLLAVQIFKEHSSNVSTQARRGRRTHTRHCLFHPFENPRLEQRSC